MNQQKTNNDVVVKCVLTVPEAKLPSYAHLNGDTCADLYSCEELIIFGGETKLINTGVIMELPEGWGAFIRQKSGLASKGIIPIGGIIDSSYRGEIKVILHNLSDHFFDVRVGMKIAQVDIRPVYRALFESVDTVENTERAANGFGSTGI